MRNIIESIPNSLIYHKVTKAQSFTKIYTTELQHFVHLRFLVTLWQFLFY